MRIIHLKYSKKPVRFHKPNALNSQMGYVTCMFAKCCTNRRETDVLIESQQVEQLFGLEKEGYG